MGKRKAIYYNFPLIMLRGAMEYDSDIRPILNKILEYCIYEKYLEVSDKKNSEIKIHIENKLSISMGDNAINRGYKQYQQFSNGNVKVGIKNTIFWDYRENDKTDFQTVCLLGFLALKSMIGNKSYYKTNNSLFFSRMAGSEKPLTKTEIRKLPNPLKKFNNEYQLNKIKKELRDNWGLKYYARYTRGFYISFVLDLDELVFQAEKNRKSNKEKQHKQAQNDALKKALERLKNEDTTTARP